MSAVSLMTFAASLAPFFPAIVSWIKGDAGEKIAGQVVKAAQNITGENDPLAVSRIFADNPKALIEFQKTLAQISKDYHLEEITDRATARARDIAIIQAGRQNIRADVMVISAASGLILCLVSLGFFRTALPGEAVGIISTIAGIFGSCLKDAYAFEFGSSRGSKEKDLQVKDFLKHIK